MSPMYKHEGYDNGRIRERKKMNVMTSRWTLLVTNQRIGLLGVTNWVKFRSVNEVQFSVT